MVLDELNKASEDAGSDLEKDLATDADEAEMDAEEAAAATKKERPVIDVVVVADIDWLAPGIFELRAQGEVDNKDAVNWSFQNVTLVLNILDALAGEERFLDIRRRERKHRVLTKVEKETEDARLNASKERQEFIAQVEEKITQANDAYNKRVSEIEARTDLPEQQKRFMIDMVGRDERRKRDVAIAKAEKERSKKIKEIDRDLALNVRGVQDFYKFCAVLIPPIPPLLVAFFVYFHRRRGEAEGVSRERLR